MRSSAANWLSYRNNQISKQVCVVRIELVFLGKTREKYLAAGIEDFIKRLSRYTRLEIKIIKDKQQQKKLSENKVKENEGRDLLAAVKSSYLVCLDRTGKKIDSEGLARQIKKWEMQGRKSVCFLIGGPLGFAPAVLKQADLVLSFSPMTFTHEMIRLLLLEQLYRAYTINAGEKYHK